MDGCKLGCHEEADSRFVWFLETEELVGRIAAWLRVEC